MQADAADETERLAATTRDSSAMQAGCADERGGVAANEDAQMGTGMQTMGPGDETSGQDWRARVALLVT